MKRLAFVLGILIAGYAAADTRIIPPIGQSKATADAAYVNVTGDTMTGSLAVDGDTTLGDAKGDTVTSNAGSWTWPNPTTFDFDAALTFDATGFTVLFKGTTYDFATNVTDFTVPNANAATEAMNQQTSDARYVEIAGDTMTGSLAVDGDVTLGDATLDTVTSNATNWIFPNNTEFDNAGKNIQLTGGLKVNASSTFFSNLTVEGSTFLGDAVGDAVTSKAGTWTFPNATTVNIDAALTLDATGQTVTCKGAYEFLDDLKAYGDTWIGFLDTDEVVVNSGIWAYQSDLVQDYTGKTVLNFNDLITFDATGESPVMKGVTWDFATNTTNVTVPDADAATEAMNQQTGDARYVLDSEKGAANGVATLGAGSLVVENPASATATPGAAKIPIADGSALLDDWVTYNPGGTDVPITDGGTDASTATAAFDNLSPLSAKGDILGYSTTNVRVGVGTDGQVLTANNGAAAGVAWTNIPMVKSGTVAGGSFAGNPKVYTVTFSTAFPDTNYAVTAIGEDNRTLTFQTKLAGSFVINTNANLAFAGDVDWTATAHNDP